MSAELLMACLAAAAATVALGFSLHAARTLDQRMQGQSAALNLVQSQCEQYRQEISDLAQLVRGNQGQSLDQRQRQQFLENRLSMLESDQASAQALERAKSRLSEGQSLNPLIQRGTINATEAHLLSLLHRRKATARAAAATTPEH